MTLFDRIFAWYLVVVLVLAAAFGFRTGGGQPVWTACYLGIHAGLLAGILLLARSLRDCRPAVAVWARGLFTLLALPVVFQSLALLLPGIHPEPWELRWIAADRAMWGRDPTVALQAWLSPAAVEVLQFCYATFYLLPIVLIVTLLCRRRIAAGQAALATVTFGFLFSYIGYLIWPTLPPYRFLWHDAPLQGLWSAGALNRLLEHAEWNRWDCFPSGHTMLTLVTLALAWRHARRLFWGMLPVGIGLVASTVALRYHYVIDVLAGIAGAGAALVLAAWLQRLDSAPPAQVI